MYTIILGVILLVLGIICIILSNVTYNDIFTFIGGVSLIFSIIILLFCGLASIDLKKDWERTICNYETLNEMVESYKKGDANWSSDSNVYNITLYKDVIEMNKTIDKHKVYHDSKWIGIWYSEEIGNLEHIKF